MDRSTRNLSIITLLVLAIFLALNHIAQRSALGDWWTVLLFLLLALGIWFYDRVSHRGVEVPEASDTVIEPVVYDHANAPIGIPDSIQLAGPGAGGPPVARTPAAPVMESAAPQAPAAVTEPVEFQSAPMPPRPRPDVDNEHRGSEAAVEAQAAAKQTSTASDVIGRDKSEPASPAPDKDQHPPVTAGQTTTIEEKSAPTTSAPAPETHPDLAAKAPEGANLPSTPVVAETSGQPVPTSVPGTAPEPVSPPSAGNENAPVTSDAVPPKTASELGNPYATERGSEDSISAVLPVEPGIKPRGKGKGKGKAKPAVPEIEVSASAAATSGVPDPNLPKNAVVSQPDDLKIIEGIGPKMEKALQAAGISTFAMLAGASEVQLREAIIAAGMRFAPTVPTWAEQASYAANGDFVGLEAYQKTLVGGRKTQ